MAESVYSACIKAYLLLLGSKKMDDSGCVSNETDQSKLAQITSSAASICNYVERAAAITNNANGLNDPAEYFKPETQEWVRRNMVMLMGKDAIDETTDMVAFDALTSIAGGMALGGAVKIYGALRAAKHADEGVVNVTIAKSAQPRVATKGNVKGFDLPDDANGQTVIGLDSAPFAGSPKLSVLDIMVRPNLNSSTMHGVLRHELRHAADAMDNPTFTYHALFSKAPGRGISNFIFEARGYYQEAGLRSCLETLFLTPDEQPNHG